ncbi:hypothetical protein ACUNV4_23235 [Granulosicoccus sp. 3-233]|uniref:hypothetical protein n=1 Tax=Granulosicoccus sp. 3-233 TaxID=3417969 RepID=UPI003D352EEF
MNVPETASFEQHLNLGTTMQGTDVASHDRAGIVLLRMKTLARIPSLPDTHGLFGTRHVGRRHNPPQRQYNGVHQ